MCLREPLSESSKDLTDLTPSPDGSPRPQQGSGCQVTSELAATRLLTLWSSVEKGQYPALQSE